MSKSLNTVSSSNYLNHRFSIFLSKQASLSVKALSKFHALIVTCGNSHGLFFASKLISQYASNHTPSLSTQVFHSVRDKDTFLWNSLIKAHFFNANHRQALDLFALMRASGFSPDEFTLPMLAVACADLVSLPYGKTVHGLASRLGLYRCGSAFGSSLVYMYSRCGETGDARKVFDDMAVRDVVAWTALVVGCVRNGESEKGLECVFEMCRCGGVGERPNFRTLEGGFQACRNLGALLEGRWLHGLAVKTGIGCADEVKSSILSMYSKCGTPSETYLSFLEVTKKDVVSWMLVFSVYSRLGTMGRCVRLFWDMQVAGVVPDVMVICCLLWGFGNSMGVVPGKAFHGLIVTRWNFISEMVDNALVSMYCKFGLMSVAEKLCGRKLQWTKELCSTMISGYCKIGDWAKCIRLFREMSSRGIEPDSENMVDLISSCCRLGARRVGRSVHCYVIINAMHENVSVTNSLIELYGKNGRLPFAQRLFLRAQKDIVTWNTMISCHIHNEQYMEAIALFDEMVSENMNPNQATFVIVLSACSHLASLEKGQKVHNFIKERGLETNLPLSTALVDMYTKCGQLQQSRDLFDSIRHKDVVSWNVMISGYGLHGYAEIGIDLFLKMENSNVKPNELTFLALLSACNHAGLVEEGKYLFSKMRAYSLDPSLKHYTCMVDLLGRSGYLQEAEDMVLLMPIAPDAGVWGSLLSACVKHKESDRGIRVAKLAIESDPRNNGYYIMLANLYSSSGRWEEAEDVRRMMRKRGVDKEVSWSVV